MAQDNIVVLAFSGGLDTCFCLWTLKQQGFAVHTVFADSGGVSEEEKEAIKQRAQALGATAHHTVDISQSVWDEFVVPLVWSHARMLGEYPMLCSDRYLIVKSCLALCDQLGTPHFAHGCTGMGNDQLRFDQSVRSLGDYQIHAPVRDLQSQVDLVRDHELKVLAEAGFEVSAASKQYSINENLLGVTLSGGEVDVFQQPAAGSYVWCKPRDKWPEQPLYVEIGFRQGRAVALNGQALPGSELLSELNQQFAQYGVGRHIYTGDVSIGLKGRIVFECPGIDALLLAHQALEDTVNTKWQNQFRQQIANRWAELVYTGFFFEPHKYDLEAYLHSSQSAVTGTVGLLTEGGSVQAVKVEAEQMLVDSKAVYAQSCHWTPQEAVGFVKLLGQSSTMAARVREQSK